MNRFYPSLQDGESVWADSAMCSFCCHSTIYGCRKNVSAMEFNTGGYGDGTGPIFARGADERACHGIDCRDPKYGCGWVPTMGNVSVVDPKDRRIRTGDADPRRMGADPNIKWAGGGDLWSIKQIAKQSPSAQFRGG